jgi:hypothetical protein
MAESIYNVTKGFTLEAQRDITKNDMVRLCKELNEVYYDCEVEPEAITEGGIRYKFNDNPTFYKSVRFCLNSGSGIKGKWPWIRSKNVMKDWEGNTDIIMPKNTKFTTILKSFRGAPPFTKDELEMWSDFLNMIDLNVVRK